VEKVNMGREQTVGLRSYVALNAFAKRGESVDKKRTRKVVWPTRFTDRMERSTLPNYREKGGKGASSLVSGWGEGARSPLLWLFIFRNWWGRQWGGATCGKLNFGQPRGVEWIETKRKMMYGR